MTPAKLVLLRAFNLTLGRSVYCNRLFRRALVFLLIGRAKGNERYMASSRFFEPSELD